MLLDIDAYIHLSFTCMQVSCFAMHNKLQIYAWTLTVVVFLINSSGNAQPTTFQSQRNEDTCSIDNCNALHTIIENMAYAVGQRLEQIEQKIQEMSTSSPAADITNCARSPCQNKGICTNLIMYTCSCEVGYTGSNCQTNINECESSPCQNGGSCTDSVNAYTCACIDGYTGSICETDVNECASSPCQNGGTCTDNVNMYKCACVTGYTGTRCETTCPSDFQYFSTINRCYKVVTEALTWVDAGSRCRLINTKAHLVVIERKEQSEIITNMTQADPGYITCTTAAAVADPMGGYWTSGQRIVPTANTIFVWKPDQTTTKPIIYTNWCRDRRNQPDFGSHPGLYGPESCLHVWIQQNMQWNDLTCAATLCSVCEIDMA